MLVGLLQWIVWSWTGQKPIDVAVWIRRSPMWVTWPIFWLHRHWPSSSICRQPCTSIILFHISFVLTFYPFRILSGFFGDFFRDFFSGDFSPLLSATFLMICFIFVCFQLVEIFPLCFLLFLSRCHAPRSCKILGGSFEDSLTFPRSQRSRATCNHKSFIISGFQGFFVVAVVAVDTVAFLNIS